MLLETTIDTVFVANGTVSILILFWCLWVTNQKDPGFVSKSTQLFNQLSGEIEQLDEENGQGIGSVKQCKFCHILKPERSHHCSRCQRCVLNMDHHCVWINNCVGLFNRKSFNLILFWGSVGMINASGLGLSNVENTYFNFKNEYGLQQYFSAILSMFTLFVVISQFFNSIGLIYFFIKNLMLVLNNISTLDDLRLTEFHYYNENTQIDKMREEIHQYNLGIRYNFIFYFGSNPILWILPVGKPLGDGYNWDKVNNRLQL